MNSSTTSLAIWELRSKSTRGVETRRPGHTEKGSLSFQQAEPKEGRRVIFGLTVLGERLFPSQKDFACLCEVVLQAWKKKERLGKCTNLRHLHCTNFDHFFLRGNLLISIYKQLCDCCSVACWSRQNDAFHSHRDQRWLCALEVKGQEAAKAREPWKGR